jgi:hypothetical protein
MQHCFPIRTKFLHYCHWHWGTSRVLYRCAYRLCQLNIGKLNKLILRLDSHWKTKQREKCNQSEESIHFANLTQFSVRVHQSSSTPDKRSYRNVADCRARATHGRLSKGHVSHSGWSPFQTKPGRFRVLSHTARESLHRGTGKRARRPLQADSEYGS